MATESLGRTSIFDTFHWLLINWTGDKYPEESSVSSAPLQVSPVGPLVQFQTSAQ